MLRKYAVLLDAAPATALPATGGGGTLPPTISEVENRTRDAERARVKNINAAVRELSTNHPEAVEAFRSIAEKAIDAGTALADFNAEMLKAIPGTRKALLMTAKNIGMSERDINEYSLGRAIQSVLKSGRQDAPEGLEGDVHKEMVSRIKSSGAAVQGSGFWVPHDIGMKASGRRDLNVTTASQGGNLVQTSILTPIIEIFRNRMVTPRLGIQSMAGLEGNIAIPRQTGAATAYSLAESATLTKSTQAIDQISLTPHRVGAYNEYTKQLLLQSSVDVENFIRDDLMKVLAIKWDKLILEGSGSASEPTGILHTPAIGSVTFGAAATYAKMVSFETALAVANADAGRMAYVTTPSTREKLKTAAKIGTTFPIFIWEDGGWNDGSNDGMVNSYRAAVTNQIAGNCVAFGNWEDGVHALWGGLDVVINPFARDIDAVVRITINTFGDFVARHAASFCWSSDSGAQ